MKADYPLLFERNVHNALWGAESWEISVRPESPSVIANGPLKGRPLNEVLPSFNLLVKVIDAKTRLSVQVHPSERTVAVTGGEPKTEMWCLLDDGFIFAGLGPGTDAAAIDGAVKSGRFEELLVRHDAKEGESFYIPGGLVHAIGDRVRLYEVQQSSNTTFRLYDWNRVGADGRPRPLHVAKSLEAIDYALPVPEPQKDIRSPFFDFRQVSVDGTFSHGVEATATVVFAATGNLEVNGVPLAEGRSALVPPGIAFTLRGSGCRVFLTRSGPENYGIMNRHET